MTTSENLAGAIPRLGGIPETSGLHWRAAKANNWANQRFRKCGVIGKLKRKPVVQSSKEMAHGGQVSLHTRKLLSPCLLSLPGMRCSVSHINWKKAIW